MPHREQRVVEIVRRITRHADPLHHTSRARIAWHGERDDLLKPEHLKAASEGCPRTLCRISLTPVLRAEAPSDLHTRREVCCETGHREPNESREGGDVDDLHGPQTEPVLVEVRLYPRDE